MEKERIVTRTLWFPKFLPDRSNECRKTFKWLRTVYIVQKVAKEKYYSCGSRDNDGHSFISHDRGQINIDYTNKETSMIQKAGTYSIHNIRTNKIEIGQSDIKLLVIPMHDFKNFAFNHVQPLSRFLWMSNGREIRENITWWFYSTFRIYLPRWVFFFPSRFWR